jgi:hypothetical protein
MKHQWALESNWLKKEKYARLPDGRLTSVGIRMKRQRQKKKNKKKQKKLIGRVCLRLWEMYQ